MERIPTTGKDGYKGQLPEYKGSILIPLKLSSLRHKLGQKAKQEAKYRFYTLYDHLTREDVLKTAWYLVKKNGGSPGVDGVSIAQIESNPEGVENLLKEISEEIEEKKYIPEEVLRVYIPKANGKLRPLGIPTIKDRIVQMAVMLILEPIFESDFLDCSYGFRPGKNAHQALETIKQHIENGYTAVYDADLQGYFDSIPHDKLMKGLEMRISDKHILKLIRMWLKTQIVEKGSEGNPKKERPKKGTPQGGVISPLLANIYLHWFDKVFHKNDGLAVQVGGKLVRYADDFVILTRYYQDCIGKWVEQKLEEWLGLVINREKTRVLNLREEGAKLDFLGFSFRYDKSKHKVGRKRYLNVFPSEKACIRERGRIKEMVGNRDTCLSVEEMIEKLNQHLRGWANYFRFGYPSKAFRKLNWYTEESLIRNFNSRSQRRYKLPEGENYHFHFKRLGLNLLKS